MAAENPKKNSQRSSSNERLDLNGYSHGPASPKRIKYEVEGSFESQEPNHQPTQGDLEQKGEIIIQITDYGFVVRRVDI